MYFLIVINIVFILSGLFIETIAAVLILTPIIFPIAQSFGVDPVHLGIIMVANLGMGLSTPPVGENQYIAAAIAKIPFDKQVRASIPFLVAFLIALVMITFFPGIALWYK
jgi:C4-dicarboxylate transporter DctM subunit